ncbi:MAG: hypothetical protein HKN40_09200 [Winogradskyella sp.]|uniref:hypothetical protein n=1 Tax=Winogradskyella sp. TaxID=1883156 RepID=UPI001857D959|nr:hypothetical protein [Winogradskyella sp.]
MLKKILIILTSILLIANFYVISECTTHDRRVINLISIICYFLVFLGFGGAKKILLLYSILAFLGTDYLLIYYDTNEVVTKVIPVLKISAYFLLTVSVFEKVKLLNNKSSIIIGFLVIIALNVLWMFNLIWKSSEKFNDNFEIVLHLLYGLIMVWMCTIAINCYMRFKTTKSLFFLLFILGVILSDASWFLAYYFDIKFFFYIYTILYFIGLAYMVRYADSTGNKDDAFLSVS